MPALITPFGRVQVNIDGEEIEYSANEGKKIENLCPEITGRYQITIYFEPDGNEHEISCILPEIEKVNREPESGERLELQSFYNSKRWKISIGLEGESGCFIDGKRVSDDYDYDYDVEYLENGMSYLILKKTKTMRYVFGIAWIDDVGWDDADEECDRNIQTWFAADPTLAL